jgi:hypothetical protein
MSVAMTTAEVQRLGELIDMLRSKGVTRYASGELDIELRSEPSPLPDPPPAPPPAPAPSRDDIKWAHIPPSQRPKKKAGHVD